jgi:hypothetical protein
LFAGVTYAFAAVPARPVAGGLRLQRARRSVGCNESVRSASAPLSPSRARALLLSGGEFGRPGRPASGRTSRIRKTRRVTGRWHYAPAPTL